LQSPSLLRAAFEAPVRGRTGRPWRWSRNQGRSV